MARRLLHVLAALLLTVGASNAQTVSNGPYYAMPAWDQTMPASTRFIVLSNMNSEAVLDRETGLVWQRTPLAGDDFRSRAVGDCRLSMAGGRQGWRLPRVDELMSLADATNDAPSADHLPPGHPFNVVPLSQYWAADHIPAPLSDGGIIVFFGSNVLTFAGAAFNHVESFNSAGARAWCVRGAAGSLIR